MAAGARTPTDLRLDAGERRRAALLFAAIGGVTVAAFVVALGPGAGLPISAAAHSYALTFPGLAILSYILGLRHGVDADHIAAIDNTTRKLLAEEKRPLAVGTWFSLGHATVVVALVLALVAATEFIAARVPAFESVGSIVGTSVSGVFLVLIGLVNVLIVFEVYRLFRQVASGRLDEAALEAQLAKRGFLNRYFGRLFRVVDRPWQIYPVGVLFGLGFDTATEIVLIAIAVGVGSLAGVPLWAVLLLPLLFTCGMVVVDTADGLAMRYAYGWAFLTPVRKIYYNLTITVISVLVAFLIGGIELLSVLSAELGLHGGLWDRVQGISFDAVGVFIVGLFVGTWALAMLIYRWRGYERRFVPPASPPAVAP